MVARRRGDLRLLQFLKVDRVWDDRANRSPRAWPRAASGALGQRLRSLPWRAVPARKGPFSSFGRGRANTPEHGDRMLRFARFAGDHLRCGTGELFVLRSIANLVPPYGPNDDLHGTSAALEFGVMGLEAEHNMLGHGGAVGWVLSRAAK